MKRLTRTVIVLVGLAGSIGLVLLTTGWGSAVASNISGVLVTNTSSNPLPVNGTVTIGGSPTVHLASDSTVNVGNAAANPVPVNGTVAIGGTPSVQLADGATVSVGNSPTVKIDPSANVVDLASHLGQEYVLNVDWTIPDGRAQSVPTFSVPQGKVFVVQHISGLFTLPGGDGAQLSAFLWEASGVGSGAAKDQFPLGLAPQTSIESSVSQFAIDEDTTLVAGAGTSSLSFIRGPDLTGTWAAEITLSGYLVSAPG
jgi:hypothetical protein